MSARALRSPKILIVDDDPGVLAGMRAYFEMIEIDVVTTSSAFEVAFIIGRELPDVVLLDVSMPVVDGVRILQSLGQRVRRSTPFLLFSGKGRRELANLTEELGAADCISKEEDMSAIERRVRFWIEVSRRQTIAS